MLLFLYRLAPSTVFFRRLRRNFLVEWCFFHAFKEVLSYRMTDSFGLKIGLEGEKEFKKALSEINQSFKVLGSEMKVVSSQFDKNDNSVQALTARNQVLNKEIEAQKQKIETLRAALANAAESSGENDRRTQNWQIQLNNATAALNNPIDAETPHHWI